MILLFASFAFNFVSIITLRKHRFLQIARTEDLIWVQERLRQTVKIRNIKWQTALILSDTEQYRDVPRDGMIGISAYRWLLAVLCLTLIVITTVLMVEILTFYFTFILN